MQANKKNGTADIIGYKILNGGLLGKRIGDVLLTGLFAFPALPLFGVITNNNCIAFT